MEIMKSLLNAKYMVGRADFSENGAIEFVSSYQSEEESTLTQSGTTVSYRGRIKVNIDGHFSVMPYNEKPRNKKPLRLYDTAHCTIRMHSNGTLSETWQFNSTLSVAEAAKARSKEQKQISAFYKRLLSNPPIAFA